MSSTTVGAFRATFQQTFPTSLLHRGEALAVRDALEMLGADMVGGQHLSEEERLHAALADARTSTAWLVSALYELMDHAPPH
jgi:hypothetical protein